MAIFQPTFKYVNGDINNIPSNTILPVPGELLLKLEKNQVKVYTKDENGQLVVLTEGYSGSYYDTTHLYALGKFNDVNLDTTPLQDYQQLIYNGVEWTNGNAPLSSLNTYCLDVTARNINISGNTKIIYNNFNPGDSIILDSDPSLDVNYNIKYTVIGIPSVYPAMNWTLATTSTYNYLILSVYDSTNTYIANKLLELAKNGEIALTINNSTTYKINVYGTSIITSPSGGRMVMYLSKTTNDTNFTYYSSVPTATSTSLLVTEIKSFRENRQLYNGNASLNPDGGAFNGAEDNLLNIIKLPDGGAVYKNNGYLFTTFPANTPFPPGSFYAFTNNLRLAYSDSTKEGFNVSDYGGIGQPIPAAGMLITVYGNAYAGDYILQSSGNWLLSDSSGYYYIDIIQPSAGSLYTIFLGATALEIHKPDKYRWET